MHFNDFMSKPVRTFAKEFQKEGHMLVFHHIPKTAGSSLTRELSQALPPYKNVHIDPADYKAASRMPQQMDAAVEAFLVEEQERRFRSISGHLRPAHLEMIRDACPYAAMFTVLRDPVARVVSAYRYCTTPKHPPYKEFIIQYPTIEAYIEDEQHQNRMWKLVGGCDQTEDAVARVFERYLFIGLVEDLTLHFEFLTALMGCPKTIATRANVTQQNDSNKVELTDALRARIKEVNMKDVAFYNATKQALEGKREQMQAFVGARRAEYGTSTPQPWYKRMPSLRF